MRNLSQTLDPLLVGVFRALYRPAYHELAPLRAVAERHSGEQHTYQQWLGLLLAEGQP